MSNGFHPGQGGPLAPPGFERKDPRPDSPDYVARHPTRYDWREDIEELIRLIYRRFGGPDEQQMNTYVNHPPNRLENGQSIWLGFDTQQLSLDVWGQADVETHYRQSNMGRYTNSCSTWRARRIGGGQYPVVRCGNATVIKTLSHNGRGISENRPKARRTPTLITTDTCT